MTSFLPSFLPSLTSLTSLTSFLDFLDFLPSFLVADLTSDVPLSIYMFPIRRLKYVVQTRENSSAVLYLISHSLNSIIGRGGRDSSIRALHVLRQRSNIGTGTGTGVGILSPSNSSQAAGFSPSSSKQETRHETVGGDRSRLQAIHSRSGNKQAVLYTMDPAVRAAAACK